jgi:hypothetical protein
VPLALEVFDAAGQSVQAVTQGRSDAMVAKLHQPASMVNPPFSFTLRERGTKNVPWPPKAWRR